MPTTATTKILKKENHVIYSSIKTIFKSLWNTFNQEGEKSVVVASTEGGFFHHWATKVKLLKSCPTLRHPMDGSLSGGMVHRILQARLLEQAAISFSRGSSQPRDWTQVSCIADRRFTVSATREAQASKEVPKTQATTAKFNKLDYIKLKHFYTAKETVNKAKRQQMDPEKYLQICPLVRGCIYKKHI